MLVTLFVTTAFNYDTKLHSYTNTIQMKNINHCNILLTWRLTIELDLCVKINDELRKEILLFQESEIPTHKNLKSLICTFYKKENNVFSVYRNDRNRARLPKELSLYALKNTGVVFDYLQHKDIKKLQIKCRHASIAETDKYLNSIRQLLNEEQ